MMIPTDSFDISAYLLPIFSILLGVYQLLILDRLLSERLREHISNKGLGEDVFLLADGVARDRVLQVAYIAGVFSFIAGLAAAIRHDASGWIHMVLWTVFGVGFLSTLSVFLRTPGFLTHTRMRHKGLWAKLTYEHFFAIVLILLNTLVIAVTFVAQQHPSTSPPPVCVRPGVQDHSRRATAPREP